MAGSGLAGADPPCDHRGCADLPGVLLAGEPQPGGELPERGAGLAIEQLRLRPADDSWLIPVRFDDCQIPDRDIGAGRTLGSIHRADLFGQGYDRNASRLAEAILRRLDHVDGWAGQFALMNRPVTAGAGEAENAGVSTLVNPWIGTPSHAPYVLAEDSAAVDQWSASLVPGDPRLIVPHVLPEPALGLHDAPVVLLMANPGSTPGDRQIDRTWLTPANWQALITPGGTPNCNLDDRAAAFPGGRW